MSPRKSADEALGTRRRIIERSIAIASVEGLEGITIGRLASELEMSKAGVLGHFGTKEALQLSALDSATDLFVRMVWQPCADERPGLTRLRALCETWIAYSELSRDPLPGGCFFITVSTEFDGRRGPVREAVARCLGAWRRTLALDARAAVDAGELPAGTDPDQIAFELLGLFQGLNLAIQLFADPTAPARTRHALDRLLSPTPGGS